MKFSVLTLFPELIDNIAASSIIGRAVANGMLEIEAVNIRDFSEDKNLRVDDYTYGGGAGMLMQASPVYDAYKSVLSQENEKPRTIYLTPQGKRFNQSIAAQLAGEEHIIFVCGHYEGIDERVLDEIVTDRYSIGDYVLTGGELPAMIMIDAVSRLIPGVLGNDSSSEVESFYCDLLEYPQYTRPEVWHDKKVPEVLLCGNPKDVSKWRLDQSVELTKKVRPDLYDKYLQRQRVIKRLNKDKRSNIHISEALRRGSADIISEEILITYAPTAELCCVFTERDEDYPEASALIEMLPAEVKHVVVGSEAAYRAYEDSGLFTGDCLVKNGVYTEKVHRKIRNKDIRRLTASDLDYVYDHYELGNRSYDEERIRSGNMFGIYFEGRLAGFIGKHTEGSIGMLYIEDAYRGKGLAQDLESFMINRELEQGNIPYGQIIVENDISFKLQDKMGLYIGNKVCGWMDIKARTDHKYSK